MSQILDPVPPNSANSIICCYVNATNQMQIARITNISNWYFERVVFPGQRLVFEAVPQALLEIHSGMMASAILSDTIPCERLALQVKSNPTSDQSLSKELTKADSKDSLEVIARGRNKDLISTKTAVSV